MCSWKMPPRVNAHAHRHEGRFHAPTCTPASFQQGQRGVMLSAKKIIDGRIGNGKMVGEHNVLSAPCSPSPPSLLADTDTIKH
mmetsp:Transcript_8883/g.16270  ORF Transcript_8883/g.16270 Transcript_8883/m.16270 type:complete len:83 (+) Transcript_8883:162-410(+)